MSERPFPPGDYDVVVVGSGPGGIQTAYSLARAGVRRCAVLSRDPAPAGMFRRFPVYQRLISWTKPDAPVERGTREYEFYDHNSLLGDERGHQALAPEFMDRAFDLPARHEMEATLAAFVERGGVAVRYECEWLATARDGDAFTLTTSDGEYRCKACVFAIGATDPWRAPIPGLEAAPHYADVMTPKTYEGRRVVIIGKRNSGFEVAQGLLPWAREVVLVSPRPVDMAVLAFSPLRLRYLQAYDEYIRGGSGSYVVDAAIERVERHDGGYRVHAHGTTLPGELVFECDEVLAATGFRAPLRDLSKLGIATINDGRLPAQSAYWESVSVPGIYFAGNVTQGSPGLRKHGTTASSTAVNGFRYNARVLARHIAATRFGLLPEPPRVERDDVVPFLVRELAQAPELRIQKGYLARVVTVGADGIRDEGIGPLASFVDDGSGDGCAVTIEYDRDGSIVPVVYVRHGTRLTDHVLPPHPMHAFDTEEHRAELAARLGPLLD